MGGWVGPWAILDKYTFMSMIVLCFFVFDDCVVYKFIKFAEMMDYFYEVEKIKLKFKKIIFT